MGRAFDFVLSGVLVLVSVLFHRIGVELFAPNTPLHELASDGTQAMQGGARADLWFQIIGIWAPLLCMGFAFVYILIIEYRRQVTTAARGRP
jgi:hypothetical protein